MELYTNFTGQSPKYIDTVDFPVIDSGLKVGTLDGLLYTTVKDGEQESYIHKFKKKSRPHLICSYDGKNLFMLGGAYLFTDRGIVDQ